MQNARAGVADDASTATLAARTLAQRRWGGTRVRRLVHELSDRADELGARERAELRLALAITDDNDDEGDAA